MPRADAGELAVVALIGVAALDTRGRDARARGASYLAIEAHGSARVPSVAKPARVDSSLPRQALGSVTSRTVCVTFELREKDVIATLGGGSHLGADFRRTRPRLAEWKHDAGPVACRQRDFAVAMAECLPPQVRACLRSFSRSWPSRFWWPRCRSRSDADAAEILAE
ncbi:MAG: hypothetical protein ABFC80_03160 [Coriobacteriales bacterium]|nr:hypothetical protein [Actinomycetes bacterium]